MTKRSTGFTIIELSITITIMAILMTLAVVNLRSSQITARDSERKSDIETIATHLDTLYNSGYPAEAGSIRGSYPSTVTMGNTAARTAIFKDLSSGVLIDPNKEDAASTLFVATNNATGTDPTNTVTTVRPAPSKDAPYVYQPLTGNGSLCNSASQTCRSFNIYTWQESSDTVAIRIQGSYR